MTGGDRPGPPAVAAAPSPPAPRLRLRLALSALVLFWERLWPRLWPAAFVALAFVAVALADLLPRLPATLHALVLVIFVAAFAYALIQALPVLRPVSRAAAGRRLDASTATADRPLATLADRLADPAPSPLTVALWQRHRERMTAAAGALRVRWPATDMARREPWGIRAGVILALVIAGVAAGGDWRPRLDRAVSPALVAATQATVIELWITPPPYTGRPPLFLRGGPAAGPEATATAVPVPVPAGSGVLARVSGAAGRFQLQAGSATAPFQALPGEPGAAVAHRAEATIVAGERLGVRAGRRELAGWPLTVIADRPPRVAFADPAAAEKGNGLLEIGFDADDDYGVAGIDAVITADRAADPALPAAERLRVPVPLAEPGAAATAGRALLDLTAHPWAGEPVRLELEASDGQGQTGGSGALAVVLPERVFSHPVARAIAAERKRLFAVDADPQAAAGALAAIAAAPDAYGGDVVVGLGLAVGRWRLVNDGAKGIATVRELLWALAVRIEDGDLPAAERRLAEARQALQEALRSNADTAEIERLMDRLQAALDAYLATLAEEIARRQEGEMPMLAPGDGLRGDDLRDLVDRAREMSRAGARDGARALLGELQRLLDGIRVGMRQQADPAQLRAAQQLLGQLRQLQERQQRLLDETYNRLREQQEPRRPGRRGNGDGAAGLDQQRALRRDLADLAERLEAQLRELPQPLAGADQAMREAIQALAGDRLGDGVAAQGRAADALGRALAASRDAFAAQLGEGGGQFGVGPGGDTGDPFGRPASPGSRGFALGTVGIPERWEIERIQQLLRELRRRAGERDRPSDELDYIKRLLQPF